MNQTGMADIFSTFGPYLVALNVFLAALLIAWMDRSRKLVEKIRRGKARYGETIENLAEGVYLRSLATGKMLKANASLVDLNGYDSTEALLEAVNQGNSPWYVDPGRQDAFMRILKRDGVIEDFVSEVYRHKTAERIWVTEKARIIPADGKGEPCFYEGSVRDITPLIRERQIEERLEKLADNLPGGLFQLVRRADGTFYCPYVSNGFVELLGLAEPLAGLDPTDYLSKVHSPDLPAYVRSLQKSDREMSLWTCEFRYHVGNDVMLWLLVTATPEKLADGSVIWHGYVKDISERKAAEEHTQKLAYYDALTELPNRRLFTNRLEMSVRAAGRRREHGAVLFLDLDNFKMLNDAHGHETGDCLLRQAAARLRDSVRACDTVGRFGGDEFVLLLDGLGSDRDAAEANVAKATAKILAQFNKGFRLDGFRHVATPSIGVVIFDGISLTAAQIINDADTAMYRAKRAGRNNYVIFNEIGPDDEPERRLASA